MRKRNLTLITEAPNETQSIYKSNMTTSPQNDRTPNKVTSWQGSNHITAFTPEGLQQSQANHQNPPPNYQQQLNKINIQPHYRTSTVQQSQQRPSQFYNSQQQAGRNSFVLQSYLPSNPNSNQKNSLGSGRKASVSNNSFSTILLKIEKISKLLSNNASTKEATGYIVIAIGKGYKCSSNQKDRGITPFAEVKYTMTRDKDGNINYTITSILDPITQQKLSTRHDESKILEAIKAMQTHRVRAIDPTKALEESKSHIEQIREGFKLSRIEEKSAITINNYIQVYRRLEDLSKEFKKLDTQTGNSPKNKTCPDQLTQIIADKGAFIKYLSAHYDTVNLTTNDTTSFPICFQPQYLSDEILIEGKDKFFTTFQQEYIKQIREQLQEQPQGQTIKPTIICGPPGSGKTDLIKFITESTNLIDTKTLLGINQSAEILSLHLDYASFYDYSNNKEPKAKNKKDIEDIINNKLRNSTENQKIFLFVDEWGVMYPQDAIDYLKTKQSESNGNLAIIGVTAHRKPIEALIEIEKDKFFNQHLNIQRISPNTFSDNGNQQANCEFIVDFTREINHDKDLKSYINDNRETLQLGDSFILISQCKNPNTGESEYMLINQINKQTNHSFINTQSFAGSLAENDDDQEQNTKIFCLTKDQLSEKLKELNPENRRIIYLYPHSVARGGDMGLIPKTDNIKYNIITSDNDAVNFADNIIQGLSRNRSLRNEILSNENPGLNVAIFNRGSNNKLTPLEAEEIKTKISQRNNYFGLNEVQLANYNVDYNAEDIKALQAEINKMQPIQKSIIAIITDYFDFLDKNMDETLNKEESINIFKRINNNIPNFKECIGYSQAIKRLGLKYNQTIRQEQVVKEHTVDGKTVAITSCTVCPQINIANDRITSDYWQCFKEANGYKKTDLKTINLTEKIPSPWNFRNITGSVGTVALGGGLFAGACNFPPSWSTSIANLIHSITPTPTSMPITSIPTVTPMPITSIPTVTPTPNLPMALDKYSRAKTHSSGENYHIKDIAINHQHSASLAGNTNIGHLGGAGATKAHISLVGTASKVGLTAKAGLLACTFTPLLAIAGIATAGYLGYKAYDYYYGKSDKINEEIANENPNTNDIKTASCKALKEIKSTRQC